jgi:DNA-binding winged helix-turn-helix (wHTH) protein
MRVRFQQFILDSDARQLLEDGKEIHLSTKAFDVLCLLLTRRPNVVAKDDLLRKVWPGSHVVEANLNVLVGEIRRALADHAQTPRFIRTVHGVGFAFCGSATEVEKVSAGMRCWLVGRDGNFVLSEGDNIIGRDPSCSVYVDDPDVSRRHALIRIDSVHKSALLEDLESTNGTLIGRSRIKTPTPLANGDVIYVGSVELKFRLAGTDQSQETRRISRKSR